MAKVKIYNLESGNEKELDAVDAREHIETGEWSYDVQDNLSLDFNQSEKSEEDPTSKEAYDQRENEFKESASEKAEDIQSVEAEIKKPKGKK